MFTYPELSSPTIKWKENGTPIAAAYDDVYYQKENGLEESRFVFLQHNHLPERLTNQSVFTVAETGFGTGLNILCLWQMWNALPAPKPKLHIITTEHAPLPPEALYKAHQAWPELSALSQELIDAYPPAIMGPHRRYLADGHIIIDWLFGDAVQCLQQCYVSDNDLQIDAWFLDGFAPSKNPDMWSDDLFAAMATLSKPETSFATFTAAGHVKRGLQNVGFEVQKTAGFGSKRDMLIGSFKPSNVTIASQANKPTIIIGGGIAGLSCAWRLAQYEISSIICEEKNQIVMGASGNPASALTPFYPKHWNQRGRLLHNSFANSIHLIKHLQAIGHTIQAQLDGMLMLHIQDGSKRSERLAQWQQQLSLPESIRTTVDRHAATDIAAIPLEHGGWHYKQGGWVNMPQLCAAFAADTEKYLTLKTNCTIQSLHHKHDIWHATDQHGDTLQADNVIVACAHAALKLLPDLELEAVHGQLIQFEAPHTSPSLQCPIHAGHTLIPVNENLWSWGASFRHHTMQANIYDEDTEMLWDDFMHAFPNLTPKSPPKLNAWAGLRCTHPSRIPLIGKAPNQPDGLYLHLAHGARGALTGMQPYATDSFVDLKIEPSCEIAAG